MLIVLLLFYGCLVPTGRMAAPTGDNVFCLLSSLPLLPPAITAAFGAFPMMPKARGYPNTAACLAGWRKVTRQVWFCTWWTGRTACLVRTVPVAQPSCELMELPAAVTQPSVMSMIYVTQKAWPGTLHCKDKMPKIWNKYSQKRDIGASVPISTFMCLWANYISPRWVCLFYWRKYVDWSWEYINRSKTHECGNGGWGRAIPRKGIYKRNCRCSVL